MILIFHKYFQKKLKKRTTKEREQFTSRAKLFSEDPYNLILNNHALHGKYAGSRSINVTGDLRAVFTEQNDNTMLFVDIDTHPNLYK